VSSRIQHSPLSEVTPRRLVADIFPKDRRHTQATGIEITWLRGAPSHATMIEDQTKRSMIRNKVFEESVVPWAHTFQQLFPNFAIQTMHFSINGLRHRKDQQDIAAACGALEQDLLGLLVPAAIPKNVQIIVAVGHGRIYYNNNSAQAGYADALDGGSHGVATRWFDRLGAWANGVDLLELVLTVQSLSAHERLARTNPAIEPLRSEENRRATEASGCDRPDRSGQEVP
jgi:hypothetical protein